MTMNYQHLPDPIDPNWAKVCIAQVKPYLPPHAEILAAKQKQYSTAVFIRCVPSLSEGSTDRLVVALQDHPAFKSLHHFTQGREMALYFTTPKPAIPWEDFDFIEE